METSPVLWLATAAGIAAHRGLFIYGEWHMQAAVILIVHTAVYTFIWITLIEFSDATFLEAVTEASLISCCYLSSLFASMVVYRLFFHRLCGFPGPVLARSTKLWHAWKGRHSKNHLLLDELHHKYGDYVRTGPSELTIFDASAFIAVNGPGTKCTKSVWYDFMQPNYSIISSRTQSMHDKRRRIWSPAFSPGGKTIQRPLEFVLKISQALRQYESRVLENVRKVEGYIEKAASSDQPVDVTSLCYWFAFDVMGEFAFAESFGMLDNQQYHHVILMLRRALNLLGPFSPVLWLARIGFALFPHVWRMADWNNMMAYCQGKMNQRIKMEVDKPDISSYLIEDAKKNGFTAVDRKFLNGDAVTVIIAGSDSSAPTLIFILYCLAMYPQHADTIFAEVADLDTHDSHALHELPHLSAVIDETLRLYPAVPTAVTRETPPEGVMIAGRFIPGNTTIAVPRYTIGRRELYFEKADAFIPERWYSKPEMVKNRHAHNPFSIGKSSCIGKNLALMDIKLVVASIIQRYHISFAPGEDCHRVYTEMQDQFTVAPGPLSLLFKLRGQ